MLSREVKKQSLKLLLLSNPKYIDILRKAIEIEEKVQDKEHYMGWEWYEVGADPALLRRLAELGDLKITEISFHGIRIISIKTFLIRLSFHVIKSILLNI